MFSWGHSVVAVPRLDGILTDGGYGDGSVGHRGVVAEEHGLGDLFYNGRLGVDAGEGVDRFE